MNCVPFCIIRGVISFLGPVGRRLWLKNDIFGCHVEKEWRCDD